jgi:glycosyltransferase involved in cell wall biosynthesis
MALRGHRFILGNMPPPIGGVSTFMRRYTAGLKAAGIPFTVRDWVKMDPWSRAAWFLRLILDPRRLRLEVNAYETWAMTALVVRPFPSHTLLRVHSGRPETHLSRGRRLIFRLFLKRVDEFVLVGPHVRDVLAGGGFEVPSHARIEPAFLPPPPDDESGILQTYDAQLLDFVESRSPLLTIQGSDTFYQGVDLYGSDLAVDALLALREEYPNIGLVIGRPTLGDARFRAYCKELDERVSRAGASDHMAILDGEREFWPVVKRAGVFLRPTALDGDSIGVREALHFDVPVVASDVVPRPPGVFLFRSRDPLELTRAIRRALEGLPASGQGQPASGQGLPASGQGLPSEEAPCS